MKRHIFILILVALLVCTGCASQMPPTPSSSATGAWMDLQVVGGEYRAVWRDTYQYDKPLLIDSFGGWEVFLMDHPGASQKEDPAVQKYDQSFFEHSVIYAYIQSEPSGSITLKILKAGFDGSTLKLFMERTVPQMGTDDMAALICLFGIRRDQAANVKKVEASISEIHQ